MPLRKIWRGLGLAVLFAGGALLGAAIGWNGTQAALPTGPFLAADPATLNLGKVDATPEFPWQIKIQNVSDRAVRVVGLKTSCDCARANPQPIDLAAGQSATVDLRINLAISGSDGARTHTAPIAVRITPVIEGVVAPQAAWQLTGTIVAPCLLESNRIVFAGSQAILAGREPPPQSIRASLADGDIQLTAQPQHPGDVVEIVKLAEPPGAIEIAVRPDASRPLGWFTSEVKLVSRDAAGKDRGFVTFEIRGQVISPIPTYPQVVSLGTKPVGAAVEARILVACDQGQLIDASPQDDATEVHIERPSAAQAEVVVRFVVDRVGSGQRDVHLVYEFASGEVATASVPVWYSGEPVKTTAGAVP
ncbi:MAG: hypothetical protein WD872_19955 [Pirellulaceae bacterium]